MTEAFICDYIRTPIGRYGGALAGIRADDLGAIPLRALAERNPGLDLAAIDEVIFGCANQAGEDNRNVARMSLLLAGYPDSVPGTTMNRLCGSGMDAVITAARAIKAGEADLIVAGGVESMSRAPFVMPKAPEAFSRANEVHDTTIGWRFVNKLMKAQYGVDSMPETAENVAADFGISRADQDAFALASQEKAGVAMVSGRFAAEIVPVLIPQRRGDPIVVDQDEHPRPDTTLAGLQKLKTFVKADGTVTAGNASGVNDGAAALILASAEAARKHGLTPMARVLGGATAGVAPRIMGFGPAPATRKLLMRLGLSQQQFDVIELNEAFASQGLATLRDRAIQSYTTFSQRWLIPRLTNFHDTFPRIEVRLSSSIQPVDFETQNLDAAIRAGKGNWPDLHSEKLLDIELIPICSPEYQREHHLVAPNDLSRVRLLHSMARPTDWTVWLKRVGATVNPEPGVRFESSALAHEAASLDGGVAIAVKILVQRQLANGSLVSPFAETCSSGEGYFLTWPKTSPPRKPSSSSWAGSAKKSPRKRSRTPRTRMHGPVPHLRSCCQTGVASLNWRSLRGPRHDFSTTGSDATSIARSPENSRNGA